MSETATTMSSSTSKYSTRGFWERLWRTAGIQFVGLFIIAYVISAISPGSALRPTSSSRSTTAIARGY